jgi:hypothetical protein
MTRAELLYALEGLIAAAREAERTADALRAAEAENARLRALLERRAAA